MKLLLSVFFTFFSTALIAQNQVVQLATIKNQANDMLAAFVAHNYDELLNYTYPKIFELSGGRNTVLEVIQTTMQELELAGYRIDSTRVGEAGSVYQAGDQLHAIISQYIYMTIPGGTMMNESPLLAVSDNNGISWYFLDTKQLDAGLRNYFFPNFNEDLIIPAPQPIIYDYEKVKY